MNILHILSAPAAGGAEIYVKDLAVELTKRGHCVHLGFLSEAKDIGRSVDFQKRYLDELTDAGIDHFIIGKSARHQPWIGATRVRNYVRDNKIEVYHAHLTYGIVFGALLKIPRLYTHHNIRMRLNGILFRLLGSLTERLVGISDACSTALENHSGRRVTTIYNGLDSKRLSHGDARVRSIDGDISCIAVGQICDQKNYALLVRAVAALPSQTRSRVTVRIAGDGSESDIEGLKTLIEEKNLVDVIRLLGHRDDIPALLAESQLFLMSSAYEGMPIALLEAVVSGLPCVVTDVGGCREIIESCQNGITVKAEDTQGFADAIEDIVGDPTRFAEYSSNALSNSSQFEIGEACERHVRLYAELLPSVGN